MSPDVDSRTNRLRYRQSLSVRVAAEDGRVTYTSTVSLQRYANWSAHRMNKEILETLPFVSRRRPQRSRLQAVRALDSMHTHRDPIASKK